jgi:hypothetical protein
MQMPAALRSAAFGGMVLIAAIPAIAQQPSAGVSRPGSEGAKADRIVAERVLRLGGAVILEGQRRVICRICRTPTSACTRSILLACRWAHGA